MSALKIKVVQPEEIEQLAALAKPIWEEHFTPIIGADQTAYMIQKFQSAPAMRRQTEQEGYRYYFLEYGGDRAGYTGVREDSGTLFLSKIYVRKSFRRKHIASDTMEFLCKLCEEKGLSKIWLTVNRHNEGSIAAYKTMGFQITRTQVADIGNGFVMDDYIMEKKIS